MEDCLGRRRVTPVPSPASAAGHHRPEMSQVRQEHPGHGQRRPLLPHQLRVPPAAEHQATAEGRPGGAEWHGVLPGSHGEGADPPLTPAPLPGLPSVRLLIT